MTRSNAHASQFDTANAYRQRAESSLLFLAIVFLLFTCGLGLVSIFGMPSRPDTSTLWGVYVLTLSMTFVGGSMSLYRDSRRRKTAPVGAADGS